MQTLLPDALASHIVAWHNRHPLARRIGIQHVQSLGYVVLPFVTTGASTSTATDPAALDLPPSAQTEDPAAPTAEGATLRERAMARALQTPPEVVAASQAPSEVGSPRPAAPPTHLLPAFTEDFIQPLRPAAVAAFALQHGALEARPGKDNPVRMVKVDAGTALPLLQKRWLLTAQIDLGDKRSRLLAGTGRAPALLGRRLWSLPRTSLAIGLPLVTVAVIAMGIRGLLEPATVQGASPVVAAAPGRAASEATTAGHAAGSTVAAAASAVQPAASAPASASASANAALALKAAPEQPIDVDPSWGRVNLPSIGPVADERKRALLAAREAAAAAATASSAQPAKVVSAAAPAPNLASPRPTQTAATSPAPAIHAGPAFALTSRLIRTKAESEQIAEAMRGLLASSSGPALQVEALRSGDDWRVVCWPFPSRAQAEKTLALLTSRGMKLQVVDF